MSSLRNAIPKRAHKERSQPHSRKKYGLLEKHKDYVVRAKAFHKKEETLRRLKEKAAFRNPDEFYFKMIKTRTVHGVHRPESQANKYTHEELMLMKTQDIGYVLQKLQSEKKENHQFLQRARSPEEQSKSVGESISDMALQRELQKRAESANCMKMRSSVQLPNQCINGDQKESGERKALFLWEVKQISYFGSLRQYELHVIVS
ncbi:hypothetical protein GH714_038758 [Hevea brasiliensis]|uniref:U3 small nucleolar RNA-associated protein 11 n=1 Tax=Hevea brasiliensis TaxID=3981 RepID=A0A6A6KYM2_HEVBR|nr:hypothetical protein GH714_038758 [Hevea brasiliensis]